MDATGQVMALVQELTGIRLGPEKRTLVEARLGKRLRQLGCDMRDYARRLRQDEGELLRCIDLITTNHTAWKREAAHFDDLARRVLPRLAGRLRIWCAAAATGEEPWTIALTLLRHIPDLQRWDAAILATDISTRALAIAERGVYPEERVQALSAEERQLALEPGPERGTWSVRPALRRLVTFARLNLIDQWPMRRPFDAIFCRNVMIYFDQATQTQLVQRLAGFLNRGGTLYVGMSESLTGIPHPLRMQGPAIYVKP
ncbi:MAG: protein-glutamate O-methyltransferase CheR [Planctomycetota bacterium]|nr:protein-glutamate O-methyltransferase CheR [Planctomycetota bacterium]